MGFRSMITLEPTPTASQPFDQDPFVIGMRSKEDFEEMQSSELRRPLNMKQISWQEVNGNSLHSVFFLGQDLCGYDGIIHGGILAGILDDVLARYCKYHASAQFPFPVTKTLGPIRYRSPAFPEQLFVAQVTSAHGPVGEGKSFGVKGHIKCLSSGITIVESEGLFVFLSELPRPRSGRGASSSAGYDTVKINNDAGVSRI